VSPFTQHSQNAHPHPTTISRKFVAKPIWKNEPLTSLQWFLRLQRQHTHLTTNIHEPNISDNRVVHPKDCNDTEELPHVDGSQSASESQTDADKGRDGETEGEDNTRRDTLTDSVKVPFLHNIALSQTEDILSEEREEERVSVIRIATCQSWLSFARGLSFKSADTYTVYPAKVWPAFWNDPWTSSGEIDIIKGVNGLHSLSGYMQNAWVQPRATPSK
jgi:hypothetical protein